jgi:hypothetical protein
LRVAPGDLADRFTAAVDLNELQRGLRRV